VASTLAAVPALVTPGDLGDELQSFVRHLRAQNVSRNTIYAYAAALVSLGNFLLEHDYATDVRAIERKHIEEWQNALLDKYKPATAHRRYRGAQRFFHWYQAINDAEKFRSPMPKLKPPKLGEYLPTVLTLDQLRALLAETSGLTFEDRRDAALPRIFFDTGRGAPRSTDSDGPPRIATST
jgi:site-specific recombinase XerD